MKLHDFLSYHKIDRNPFAEEDAQTDRVFKEHCISSTYHPAWDKVYGDPANPSTAIVFGEKGAGKTALRLQVEQHIEEYNREHPEEGCFVVSYDDFNPILDHFRERIGWRSKRPEKLLQQFQLWDHMDAILSLAVTQLVSSIIGSRSRVESSGKSDPSSKKNIAIPRNIRKRLDRQQRRDLMLLASCYDNSTAAPLATRLSQLRRRIGGGSLASWWPFALGSLATLGVCGILIAIFVVNLVGHSIPADVSGAEEAATAVQRVAYDPSLWETCFQPYRWAYLILPIVAWLPWLFRSCVRWSMGSGIARGVRTMDHSSFRLGRSLMRFSRAQLSRQPLPNKSRTDDRYALLGKLQGILKSLGFPAITVLVDRLDEPHLINGSSDAMKALLWPMLDNKFLKQEGIGIKFLLPIELTQFIDREDRDFYQRARLDKQNMIPSLLWSGQALYDVASARLAACSDADPPPKLAAMLDASIEESRVFDALQSLRVPRHMFKFLYRAIMAHCNQHSDESPAYRISSEKFETELALYRRDQENADRGLGA